MTIQAYSDIVYGRASLLSAAIWIVFCSLVIHLLALPQIGQLTADAKQYLEIARGLPTIEPFAQRPVIPRTAAWISVWTGLDLQTSFMVVKFAALMIFMVSVAMVLISYRVPAYYLLLGILAAPAVAYAYSLTFIPDFESASFTALCLALLALQRPAAALAAAFAAAAIRETGLVPVALLTLEFAVRRRIGMMAVALALMPLSVWIRHVLSTGSLGNVHGMNQLAYTLLKIPYNFLKNWLGIEFCTGGFFECRDIVWTAPEWIPKIVGVPMIALQSPDFTHIAYTLVEASWPLGSSLGILLAVLWCREVRIRLFSDTMIRVAALSGLLYWLIGTVSGAWIAKLVAAAWTLPVLVVPLISGLAERRALLTSAWVVTSMPLGALGMPFHTRELAAKALGPWGAAFLVLVLQGAAFAATLWSVRGRRTDEESARR